MGFSDEYLRNHHKAKLISKECKKRRYTLCHFFKFFPKKHYKKVINYNTKVLPGVSSELYVCRQQQFIDINDIVDNYKKRKGKYGYNNIR